MSGTPSVWLDSERIFEGPTPDPIGAREDSGWRKAEQRRTE